MKDGERTREIFRLLKLHYPHAKMILNYGNNWELLAAVMLSAQCTDAMVNKVTANLFGKFRNLNLKSKISNLPTSLKLRGTSKTITPEIQEIVNFALVPIAELEQDIRSTGFYREQGK